ncbi:MAG: phosphopantetheine adenylyltransferase [Pseudomonadales bacterium]|jgi:hypothetical protein|nr:phosphopantetheine adenylyltransferase [Pseudomonadales bacterium]
MRTVTALVLGLVALLHLLPAIGVLGGAQLQRLYGVEPPGGAVELLLRHRAVSFGLLGAFLASAAFRPELHGPALLVGFVSVASFLMLARGAEGLSAELAAVLRADRVAFGLLLLGAVAHGLHRA